MLTTENIRLIVEFIGAVAIAFMTYYLTKSHYDRKRRDDLVDRDYNRRIQLKNQKLAEVQSYLDNRLLVAQKLLEYQTAIILTDQFNIIQRYETEFQTVSELTRLSANGTTNFSSLGDVEFTNLNLKLNPLFLEGYDNISELLQRRMQNEPFEKEALIEKVSKFYKETLLIISKMQIRLDKLAETENK